MQIRLNRDPIKIAAATLTPVFLTLILAKAVGPLGDNEAVPAAEPATPPSSQGTASNAAALEPVLFGQEAIAPQVGAPLANAGTEAADPEATAQTASVEQSTSVGPVHALQAAVSHSSSFARIELAAPSAPASAPAQSTAKSLAATPSVGEVDRVAPALAEALSPMAAPPAPAAAPESPMAVAPPVSTPPIDEQPGASTPAVASAAPAPNAAEDAARVASALDKAKAETARAEALASSPGDGPSVLPETKLALADWNYSLPPGSSRVSGFADSSQVQGFGSAPAQPAARAAARPAPASKVKSRLAQPSARKLAVSGTRRNNGNLAEGQRAPGKYRMVGSAIEFQLPVQVDGEAIGQLTMHVVPNQPVALHLKELVSLFATQIDPQALQALNASSSINEFITFERLREAGIDIRYDAARDQIRLSVDQP